MEAVTDDVNVSKHESLKSHITSEKSERVTLHRPDSEIKERRRRTEDGNITAASHETKQSSVFGFYLISWFINYRT